VTGPYVLTAEQMRAVDRAVIEATGLPSLILMENAGRGVAEIIVRRARSNAGRSLVAAIVCGPGNNGGDGFVIARQLSLAGAESRVLLAVPRAKIVGDPATMLRALDGLPNVSVRDPGASDEEWASALAGADVVVDALFGTGLRADVSGTPAVAIAAMNDATGLKVAVDIPSGLDADTAHTHGVAVRADVTVTIAARKLGLVIDPQAPVGQVEVVPLGAPIAPAAAQGPYCHWLEEGPIRESLPRRGPESYKGTGGHVVVVAGSAGKTGAAVLTGRAALRVGAGLVTIATTAAGQIALDAKVTEVMTASYSTGDDAGAESFQAIAALLARPHVRAMAVGPGIPTGPGMRELVEKLVGAVALPMVVDADGLNLLGARAAEILAAAPSIRIVTPHPGEMARLCGRTTAQVQAGRLSIAREFSARSRAIVVLKGARTLIVAPDGTAFVNPAVEPALATAGSGDVLTGVIGGLLAQAMNPLDAACAAVFLHGCAGRQAAREHGTTGVIAGDLPEIVAAVRLAWAEDETATDGH
jgi:hydroxyethylthiazole kinase-like uncharacterized protein yjeF